MVELLIVVLVIVALILFIRRMLGYNDAESWQRAKYERLKAKYGYNDNNKNGG